jgi:heme oxygenase
VQGPTEAAPPSDDIDAGFAAQIRVDTLEVHAEAEQTQFVRDLLDGALSPEDYGRFAVQLHAIYGTLEAVVDANRDRDPVVAQFFAPELVRVPSLQKDLEFLLGEDWATKVPVLPATQTYCERITEVGTWPAGLLAHHYVRYLGDLSGGQVIGRALQRIYELDDRRGVDFYFFDDIPSAKAFKDRYRAMVDALPWDADERVRFIDEVTLAYRHNTAVFNALTRPH